MAARARAADAPMVAVQGRSLGRAAAKGPRLSRHSGLRPHQPLDRRPCGQAKGLPFGQAEVSAWAAPGKGPQIDCKVGVRRRVGFNPIVRYKGW